MSIMDRLGNARRWAAHTMANDGLIDARDKALVDVIRAVEELAKERHDKPASASVGYDALPTANEIREQLFTMLFELTQEQTKDIPATVEHVCQLFAGQTNVTEALGRVRKHINVLPTLRAGGFEVVGGVEKSFALKCVDDELAKLEAPRLTSDHNNASGGDVLKIEPTKENFRRDIEGLSAFAKLVVSVYGERDPETTTVIRSFAALLDSYVKRDELK